MPFVVANAGDIPAELIDDLGGQLKGLANLGDMGIQQSVGAVKDLADSIKGLGDAKTAEQIGKEAQDIGRRIEGLGGLLGGKKKDG